MNANDRFEILAGLYYARYHELAPGKDRGKDGAGVAPMSSQEAVQNSERWNGWLKGQAFQDALAAIHDLNAQAENDKDALETARNKAAELETEVEALREDIHRGYQID